MLEGTDKGYSSFMRKKYEQESVEREDLFSEHGSQELKGQSSGLERD